MSDIPTIAEVREVLREWSFGARAVGYPVSAAEPAATPPVGDVGPVDWHDPAPSRRVVHAPSVAHRVYPAATQAARDWAWRKLGGREFGCLDWIGHFESGWRVRAGNPDGSWGIFQARPGAKYAKYALPGEDWRFDAMPQVRFGIAYANARYGSPCRAWAFWRIYRWW